MQALPAPEVAISTILGALAMEPTREKAEANLLNLLIVDDERSIREGCRDVAQGIGYSTYIADNAEHAFRVLDTTCDRRGAAGSAPARRGRPGGAAKRSSGGVRRRSSSS